MMTRAYNIDEIFALAEKIERDGAEYYRRAAEFADTEEKKRRLEKLTEMELGHEQTFAAMRADVSESSAVFDPDGEAARYLERIVDGRVFDYRSAPAAELAGKSLAEIYRKAIDLEKDSIVFYLGIRDLVPEGKDRIEAIIREEMGHIALLSEELATLGQ